MHGSAKKKWLSTAALLALALVVTVGCGKKSEPAPTPATEPSTPVKPSGSNDAAPKSEEQEVKKSEPANVGEASEPAKLAVRWADKVQLAQEAILPGSALKPGFSGRVVLVDAKGTPVEGDGTLFVELNEMSADSPAQATLREGWEIPPAVLKTMLKVDEKGAGYTLFLPWSSQRPDFKTGQLRVRFESTKGAKLEHSSDVLTLDVAPAPPATPMTEPAKAE